MKRPFACIGFSALFSLVLAVEFGHTAALCIAAVCFILLLVMLFLKFRRRKNTVTAMVCLLSACVALIGYYMVVVWYVQPIVEVYDGQYATVTALVTSDPYTENGVTSFNVCTKEINGQSKRVNMSITTSYAQPISRYDEVSITGKINSVYQNGYGYSSYCGARGIFLQMYINDNYGDSYTVTGSERPFYACFHDVRKYISATMRKYLAADLASVATAIITGEKDGLPENVYSNFKLLGVSHILVVSGLHLSIVAGLLYAATSKMKKRGLSAIVQIAGVLAFAALTGFGFSVVRALIMAVVVIIGAATKNHADSLNSLGLAAAILCLYPLNVGDIGLLWSFSSALSIILFSKRIYEFIIKHINSPKSLVKKFIGLLSASVSAMIGSIPFMIFVSGNISPYTLIVNLLLVPFTGVVIICGGFAVLCFALKLNFIAYPVICICGITVKYLCFVTEFFSALPYSGLNTNKMFVYLWFSAAVLTAVLLYFFDKKRRYTAYCAIISVAVFVLCYCVEIASSTTKVTLSVLDVGNGITAALSGSDDVILLGSYGEKYQFSVINNFLSDFDNVLCAIDIPTDDAEYNYYRKILSRFDAENILVYDNNSFNEKYAYSRYKGITVQQIDSSYTLYTVNGAEVRICICGESVWEYISVYGKEILISAAGNDFSDLPEEFSSPSAVVLSEADDSFFDVISKESYVIVSAYGDECDKIINSLYDNGYTADATNGEGRIDLTINKNGSVHLSRKYTGGVTRYADDN